MKKLVLITLKQSTNEYYSQDLEAFFGKYVKIRGCSIEEGLTDTDHADLIVYSGIGLPESVKLHIHSDAETIYMNRTYTREGFKKVQELPTGITAMVVCNDMFSAVASTSILDMIGNKHVKLVPVYPEMEDIPDLKYAITPAQTKYVPPHVEHVVDLGWRVIDTSTMLDIATKLGIMNKELYSKILTRHKQIMPINLGVQYMIENSSMVLNMTHDGIIYTDNHLIIKDYNASILNIMDISAFMGKSIIGTVIPEKMRAVFETDARIDKYAFKHPEFNKILEVSKQTLMISDKSFGHVFSIEDKTEMWSLEHRLRDQSESKGHIAKYEFKSIIGNSHAILNCKDKALKISVSDNVVLLIGESGTGKELFAQSVHNASHRRKMPFLAINCSALYPQLLESELFGYEDGAFSGAKKGGKKGLFELADKGTLFLDEIGELPLSVQAKFLRILEEKELIRVGGSDILSVDVRIIAATNKELKTLVQEKQFRKDLYYRLNIFPLAIPALKERKEDILLLAKHFMHELGIGDRRLNSELSHIFMTHSWPGNVRELRNCIEYMAFMTERQVLGIEDLPPSIEVEEERETWSPLKKKLFKGLLHDENRLAVFVLECVGNRPSGRRVIYREALKEGFKTTEYEVRKVMMYLKENGYFRYDNNKKGPILSQRGVETLMKSGRI